MSYLVKKLSLKEKSLNKIKVKVGILNLMPNLEKTEKDFKRVLDNPLIQVDLDFIYLETKKNKKACQKRKYKSFSSIKNTYYDGLIITGAPLEHLNFLDVDYIEELEEFFRYSDSAKSTIFLCWAAEFSLNYFYNVRRIKEKKKLSGLYEHYIVNNSSLVKGLSQYFLVPQSRYYSICEKDVLKSRNLVLISKSDETGPFIMESKDKKKIFITGHLEYSTDTLDKEYKRDLKKGLNPLKPKNYYYKNKPQDRWKSEATILYQNWLYYLTFK